MTVTNVHQDPETLTLTIVSDFDASIDRVWQMWADPRLLERWWGPPTYPATVVDHDLAPDGTITYFMTGPEGDRHHGWWRVLAVDPPRRLEFEDGFADDAGIPNADLPVTSTLVTLDEQPGGSTRMSIVSRFPSLEAMQQMTEMGMVEGMSAALGQIDDLLRAEVTPT